MDESIDTVKMTHNTLSENKLGKWEFVLKARPLTLKLSAVLGTH